MPLGCRIMVITRGSDPRNRGSNPCTPANLPTSICSSGRQPAGLILGERRCGAAGTDKAILIQTLLILSGDAKGYRGRKSWIMLIRKYEPRRATPEEVRRYFLQYYCNVPDALFGTPMDIEGYLNAETLGWLGHSEPEQRLRTAA